MKMTLGAPALTEEPTMPSNKDLKNVARAVTTILSVAADEKRITCGLKPAINQLSKEPDKVLFCVMPQTKGSAEHIQSVLLQAYCYEYNISIIKVDCINRLRKIVGADDCSCVLIHKNNNNLFCLEEELERILNSVDAGFISQPVFELPTI